MVWRSKASRTYQDSLENDAEILGSTERSGAPVFLHSATSSRPAKRAAAASSTISHRYNYRDNSDAEDGDEDFVASPLAVKDGKDFSDV